MQPVSLALLTFHRLKKHVVLGSAIVLLMPPYTANATATFYGSLYAHFSLVDVVQLNTPAPTAIGNSNPSDADQPAPSALRTSGSVASLWTGASIVETSYVSSVPTNEQSSPAAAVLFSVTSGGVPLAKVAMPQDLYASLLDETVTITAKNNTDYVSVDAGNQQMGDDLVVLETSHPIGLTRIAEASRGSAVIDSCPDSTFDDSSSQGAVGFEDPDVRIESRLFEDAVRHNHKADKRQLIQF